jgi:hypothetical protein
MASREKTGQTTELIRGTRDQKVQLIVQRSEWPERFFMNTFFKEIFEAPAGRGAGCGRDFEN